MPARAVDDAAAVVAVAAADAAVVHAATYVTRSFADDAHARAYDVASAAHDVMAAVSCCCCHPKMPTTRMRMRRRCVAVMRAAHATADCATRWPMSAAEARRAANRVACGAANATAADVANVVALLAVVDVVAVAVAVEAPA